MKLYKRLLALLLTLACCLSLAACQSENPTESPTGSQDQPGDPSQRPSQGEVVDRLEAYTPVDDSPSLLSGAKWIWAETTDNDAWVDFRRTFTLDSVPAEAIAEIAVENVYFLWVNGKPAVYDGGLKRGPNKTDGYFDEIDLAPYLKEGENTIAVKAWFWGVKDENAQSYSNIPVETAGFIFAMDAGGQTVVSDGQWTAFHDEAYKDDRSLGVPQPNERFPEYNIYYVASDAKDAGWTEPDYDDSGWSAAQERGSYGDAPWNALHRRPIPQLVEFGLTDYLNTADYADYTTTEETRITMEAPYNAQLAPYLDVTANTEAVITIVTENTESTQSVYTTYVTSAAGRQEFESPAWISGQHITYIVPAGITIHRLAYRESGYDTQLAGAFSMADDFFDTLWQMGVRTQYVCIRENFMDCPDRERAQWTGDATTQMRMMMYCLDPSTYPLYQKMIAQKAAWVVTDSSDRKMKDLLATVMPIYNEYYELPAQEMAGIIGVWDYYLYTGDVSVIYMIYEPSLNYLKKWSIGDDGLVKHKTGQGLVDWQDTGSNKVDTKVSENAWYYWALSTVRKMALGLGEDTTWLDETMAALYDGYQTLWADGKGYFVTGEQPDDRGNALAVLAGLVPEENYETVIQVLNTSRMASSYMEAYVLQALCELGHVSDALDRMQERYADMIRANLAAGDTTLWEYFEDIGTKNHAWAGSPVFLLSRYVGGIRPTASGYSRYEILPDFSHSDTVHVTVETVLGTIRVDGRRGGTLTVSVPDGGEVTVGVPKAGAGAATSADGLQSTGEDDNYTYFTLTSGGKYTFEG